ncbi:MAG TPA: hypothetical protein VMH79_02940 [Thermoanaerobaculia bacterium]|nr:hypothetical protein [Thermoanaerobaculia bacterium]
MRAGIQLVPDPAPPRRYFGVSAATGRLGCDALAAAWFAEFYDGTREEDDDGGLGLFLSAPLAEAYPVLLRNMGPDCALLSEDCPRPAGGYSLEQKIIHLQDEHGYTREHVVFWLEQRGL